MYLTYTEKDPIGELATYPIENLRKCLDDDAGMDLVGLKDK
jgi:hypothetical protein